MGGHMTREQRASALRKGADPVALTLHLLASALMQPEIQDVTAATVNHLIDEIAGDDAVGMGVRTRLRAQLTRDRELGMCVGPVELNNWFNRASRLDVIALVNQAHTGVAA